jgi:hypothetical protein
MYVCMYASNKMYVSVQSNTIFSMYNIIKDKISDMFRLLYKTIFRLQLKRAFHIQLAMSLNTKCGLHYNMRYKNEV